MARLPLRRQLVAGVVAAVTLPALTSLLVLVRSPESLASDALLFLLVIVIVALIGGIWPALAAALAAALLLDWFLIAPVNTAAIADPLHAVVIMVFVIVAALVSATVELAERRSRAARAAQREASVLADLAETVLTSDDAISALTRRVREIRELDRVRVLRHGQVIAESRRPTAAVDSTVDGFSAVDGSSGVDGSSATIAYGGGIELEVSGHPLVEPSDRVLRAFAAQIELALVQSELAREASRAEPLEAADRMRVALLAAVGHDLRTPLAAATAAVSSLASTDVEFSPTARAELVATAEISLTRLAHLVADLLDASRLQAGVLAVACSWVAVDDVIGLALDEIGASADEIVVELPADGAVVWTDPVLVQRIIANVAVNALRFSPPLVPPRIVVERMPQCMRVLVIDHGPGIPAADRESAFAPFQRQGDQDVSTGVGLGLAVSRGFAQAIGASLDLDETSGGGLTVALGLPVGFGVPVDESTGGAS